MSTMTIRDVAAAADLSVATVRRMHATANTQRQEGRDTARTLPAPVAQGDGGANLWDADEIGAWLEERATPARRGAVPKDVVHDALRALQDGRVDAAMTILRGALT